MQNLSGHKLGNYELRERLGRGGMAEVYKAYQPSMDRFVAIKVMLGHLAEDDNFIERFKREAQAVGKLRHPHIIDIFDFGIEDDIYYMAMEYLTDDNLKEYIDTHEKIPLKDSLKITRDLADALDYAHKSGMIHRDMKPANIMFLDKAKLNVVLTDFGIARILNATGLTGTGMTVGTPAYMSPEAGAGTDADERADIYALGIILYEMLVGKVPYNADTPLAVIMKHINAPLPTRNDYGDNIPEPVERIMLKCLAKDPDDRYSSAGELRDALNTVLAQVDNLAKTESVHAKQAETELTSMTKTGKAGVIAEDAATTSMNWADTEAITGVTKTSNAMMLYAGIAIVAVIILAGLFLFRESLFGTTDEIESTEIAEVIETEEATVVRDEPTDTPEPTAIPEEPTNAPQATAVPTVAPEPLEPIAPPHEWNLTLQSLDMMDPPLDGRNIEVQAEQLLFESRVEDAINLVDEILSDDFVDMPEYAAKVRIAVATGDFDTALETAEFMYELDRNNPHAHINLLDALYMLPEGDSQYEWAQEILEEGQALVPEDQGFVWRSIIFAESKADKMALFNEAEDVLGARGWRFVLFAGNFLYQQGEYQRAIPYLETAMQLPPEVFYKREPVESQLQYARGQLDYMALNPDKPLSLGGIMPPLPQNLSVFSNVNEILNEADAIVFAGDRNAALEYINNYIESDPDNYDALFARSQIWSIDWDPENLAGQDAQRLIELQPDNVLSYIAMADSWMNYPLASEEGSIDEALAILEQAHQLDPGNPHIMWRLAFLGEWEMKSERLMQAEEAGASGWRFVYTMADYLHATGNYARAIPYWEAFTRYTAQGTYSQEQAFWNLLGAMTMVGDGQGALDFLIQSGTLDDTTESMTFTDAAYIAYSAGNYDLAEDWANTALAFSGEAYGARWILGDIAYYRDGDIELAFERLEAVFNDGGNENNSRYLNFAYGNDLNLERGRILFKAERYEDALLYYNEILTDYDYTNWLYEERANLYIALGEVESARQDLQRAFDISENPDYRAYLRDRIIELGPASDG